MRNEDFMTPYEKRILCNKKKTKGDLLKDQKMFGNTVKNCLGMEFDTELDDGTVVSVPLAQLLVAKRVGYLLENPKDINLKEISSVLGENKIELETTIKRGADELFGDIVVEEVEGKEDEL